MPGFLTVWEKKYTASHCPLTANELNLQVFFVCLWPFPPSGRTPDAQPLVFRTENVLCSSGTRQGSWIDSATVGCTKYQDHVEG